MGKMTVYHGSYTAIEHPQIVIGRNTKDFGPGFYCTMIREQAQRWAMRYHTPVINTYTVRLNTSLNILEFRDMTEDWLDFIISCRHGDAHTNDTVPGRTFLPDPVTFLTLPAVFPQYSSSAAVCSRSRALLPPPAQALAS